MHIGRYRQIYPDCSIRNRLEWSIPPLSRSLERETTRHFFTSGNHDRNEITSHFGAAKDWLPIQKQIGDGAGYDARAID